MVIGNGSSNGAGNLPSTTTCLLAHPAPSRWQSEGAASMMDGSRSKIVEASKPPFLGSVLSSVLNRTP